MEYILGQVKDKLEDSIILQVNNIGYRIHLNNTEEYKINKEFKFYIFVTQTFLNSTIHTKFFGFETIEQKHFFAQIISINVIMMGQNQMSSTRNILYCKQNSIFVSLK